MIKQLNVSMLTFVRMASNAANKESAIKDSIVPLSGLIAQFTGMPALTLFNKSKKRKLDTTVVKTPQPASTATSTCKT